MNGQTVNARDSCAVDLEFKSQRSQISHCVINSSELLQHLSKYIAVLSWRYMTQQWAPLPIAGFGEIYRA